MKTLRIQMGFFWKDPNFSNDHRYALEMIFKKVAVIRRIYIYYFIQLKAHNQRRNMVGFLFFRNIGKDEHVSNGNDRKNV